MIKKYSNFLFYFCIIAFCFIIFLLAKTFGNTQLAGMDGGVLVNSAYMSYLGYKPYHDFVTAVPPGFLIGSRLAMTLFGLHWGSLVIMNAVYGIITFILLAIILNKIGFLKYWSLLIAIYLSSIVMVMKSYWYYGEVTMITTLVFIVSAILFYKNPKPLFNKIVFVIFTSLVSLMKINIASTSLFLIYLFLFIDKKISKKLLTITTAISIALSLSILFVFNIGVPDLISNYFSASSRVFSLESWKYNLYIGNPWEVKDTFVYTLPIMLVFASTIISDINSKLFSKKNFPILYFAAASIFIGIISLGTNNNFNMVDGTYVMLGIIIYIWEWKKHVKDKYFKKIALGCLAFTLLFFSILGIYDGSTRFDLREALPPGQRGLQVYFDELTFPPTLVTMNNSFFRTLRASRLLYDTVNDIGTILNLARSNGIDVKKSVFIGPRVDFSYAVYGIYPPKGLPLWWESYANDLLPQNKKMVEKFKKSNVKVAIFFHRDYTFFPTSLIDYLNNDYDVFDYNNITIHVLKNDHTLDRLRSQLEKNAT